MVESELLFHCLRNDDQQTLLCFFHHSLPPDFAFVNVSVPGVEWLRFSPPALCVAAFYGSEGCFRTLLGHGADVNAGDSVHHSASHYAARGGATAILGILDGAGASFDGALAAAAEAAEYRSFCWLWALTTAGLGSNPLTSETVLHCAARGGDARIIDLLLSSPGVDPNATTEVFFLENFVFFFAKNVILSFSGPPCTLLPDAAAWMWLPPF
jgi:hypothetical protein